MSWLSAILGLILVTLFAILAQRPQWDSIAHDLAQKVNGTVPQWRIDEASKTTSEVDRKLHEYFFHKMQDTDEFIGKHVLDTALEDVATCIEDFYGGMLSETFQDCMEHVLSIHLTRMENENKKIEEDRSGASRLKIWL